MQTGKQKNEPAGKFLPAESIPSAGTVYSKSRVITGGFGNILYQEEVAYQYTVRFYFCLVDHEDAVTCIETGNAPFIFINLKRDVVVNFGYRNDHFFHERGFNIFYNPGKTGTVFFQQNRKYAFATIHFPPGKFPSTPQSAYFINSFNAQRSVVYAAAGLPATREMMQVVSSLLYTSGIDGNYYFTMQKNITGLLHLALEQLSGFKSVPRIPLKPSVTEAIYDIRDLLHNSLNENYTLKELTRFNKLSPRQINAGFLQVYGMSFFIFRHHYRMEHAMNLVTDTPFSYDEIALRIGYKSVTSFFNRFRKFFGNTPKYFRDQ